MKILHISDTHGRHASMKGMPDADVIIHSGDISENGTEEEVISFIEWFESLDYKYKVFVAGNHDTCLFGSRIDGLKDDTFYLDDDIIEIERIKIFGTCIGNYDKIPEGTDILVTHYPPLGILDGGGLYGDRILLDNVFRVNPKFHLFGHVHESSGIEVIDNVTFSNASNMDVYHLFEI